MLCKPYGKTGKMISVISSGGMRFLNPQDIDGSAATVLRAYKSGVNYFDTAPGYCADKSEDITGAAVRQMTKGTFYVSTKTFADTEEKLFADLERSLKRLGVERIDFYHIWCITSMDVWKARQGGVKAALKAKQQGLIDHVCVSSHMPGEELAEILKQGYFDGVTLGYCAINFPYRQAAVELAGKMRLGVIAMNPMGGGLIPQNAERFDFIRGPGDADVVQAALRFNTSNPHLTSSLVGFSDPAQVDQAVAAVKDFQPSPPEHFAALRERIIEQFDGLCTGCGYCMPCPKGIEVPKMMDAYNLRILMGSDEGHIINRLKWHWGKTTEAARACSLCGACEGRCTQHLPIRDRMKEIGEIVPPK